SARAARVCIVCLESWSWGLFRSLDVVDERERETQADGADLPREPGHERDGARPRRDRVVVVGVLPVDGERGRRSEIEARRAAVDVEIVRAESNARVRVVPAGKSPDAQQKLPADAGVRRIAEERLTKAHAVLGGAVVAHPRAPRAVEPAREARR